MNKKTYKGQVYYILVFHNPLKIYYYKNNKYKVYEPELKINQEVISTKKSKIKNWK